MKKVEVHCIVFRDLDDQNWQYSLAAMCSKYERMLGYDYRTRKAAKARAEEVAQKLGWKITKWSY